MGLIAMKDLPQIKNKNINYFVCPALWQEVIFRNYGLVPNDRIAKVLETSEAVVIENAKKLGLEKISYNPKWLSQGYITIIRANWHLLTYAQIAMLLQISLDKLSAILREEDFLDVKLGNFKPETLSVKYEPLTDNQKELTEIIRQTVAKNYLPLKNEYFDFNKNFAPVEYNSTANITDTTNNGEVAEFVCFIKKYYDLSHLHGYEIILSLTNNEMSEESYQLEICGKNVNIIASKPIGILRGLQEVAEEKIAERKTVRSAKIEKRILHSYLGGCGDILTLEKLDYFPEQLLVALAKAKVNGVWLTAIMYQLIKFPYDSKFSEGHSERIKILAKLTKKLKRFGIRLYLYINEPRALPLSFFENKKELLGTSFNGSGALCTSVPEVKNYIKNSVTKVCKLLPDIGGFISITMSENLTNCYSRSIDGKTDCPRCAARNREDVTAEVNNLIQEGITEANSDAKLIAWNWGYTIGFGWSEIQTLSAFEKLDKKIDFMAISEDLMEIEKHGVKTYVQDYSISNIGPSVRTKTMLEGAKKQGRKTFVKVQLSNSWEMCITPYLPVFETNFKHLQNLSNLDVSGLMLSWTHGGYPSPNLSLAKLFYYDAPSSLDSFYFMQYKDAANLAKSIVKTYSEAFSQYPFSLELIYTGAQHSGATNPFYAVKTGMQATMVAFAYDDLALWRGNYSQEAFIQMLESMLDKMQSARGLVEKLNNEITSQNELKVYCNVFKTTIQSLYNQAQFITARDVKNGQKMLEFIELETENVKQFYANYIHSNLIGYEASNHYLFTQNDILKKLANLELLKLQVQKS